MSGNRFYRGDKESEGLFSMSPEVQSLIIQNSQVWEEGELIKRSVYEIISRTGFRANFAETADFISSISHKPAPDLKEEIGMVNIQILCGTLTREDHLPKMVRKLSNQQIKSPKTL